MALAIDRFRERGLPSRLERQAQDIAVSLPNNRPLLLGYLKSSVAIALERPRWRNRDRLAVDLRAVEIALAKDREDS